MIRVTIRKLMIGAAIIACSAQLPAGDITSLTTIEEPESAKIPDASESFRTTLVGSPSFMNGGNGSLVFDAEVLFMQLNLTGGLGQNAFDYDPATRFALGYMGCKKLGIRTTYFAYDDQAVDAIVGTVRFDTYNLDFEVFKQIELTRTTDIEFSGGLRYNHADHIYDGDPSNFDGLGPVVGIRVNTDVPTGGSVYGRAKFAMLSGKGAHDGDDEALDPARQSGRDQTEIGVGYQHPFAVGGFELVPRVGAEIQNWGGYSMDPVDEHPDTDLFLAGFVVGLDVRY